MGGSKYTAGHFSVINNKYYFENIFIVYVVI